MPHCTFLLCQLALASLHVPSLGMPWQGIDSNAPPPRFPLTGRFCQHCAGCCGNMLLLCLTSCSFVHHPAVPQLLGPTVLVWTMVVGRWWCGGVIFSTLKASQLPSLTPVYTQLIQQALTLKVKEIMPQCASGEQ